MGKLILFITVVVFLDILFLISGLALNSGNSTTALILELLTDPSNVQASGFYLLLLGGIGLAVATATVVIGVFTRDAKTAVILPIAVSMIVLIQDFIAIYSHVAQINKVFALIFIGPFIALFPLVLVEWFMGKD